MKKTISKKRNLNSKSNEKFARKTLSQIVISLVMFTLVFINSKLPYTVNQNINKAIKHYLVESIDFNKVVKTAKIYIDDILDKVQTRSVGGDFDNSSADES